jgi:Ca-activated chloride channel family protein
MPQELKVKARWEHDEFPAGRENQRGLLIDVTAPRTQQEKRAKRPPLNLALVIDRSGSMGGDRLAAAKRAAIGISQQLRKDDRLSIVAYDTELLVLLDGTPSGNSTRAAAPTSAEAGCAAASAWPMSWNGKACQRAT